MPISPGRMRALAGAIAVMGIVAAGLFVSPSTMLDMVDSMAADPFTFGLVVTGLYLVRPLLAWPTTPLAVVVGYGFGVAVGLPVALAGVVTTVLPVFFAVRWLAVDDGTNDGGLFERTGDTVSRYYDATGPLRGVTASRLAPIPSDVATCAAAVSDVEPRHLLIGTAIGELPWTTAAVVVGASAATITSSGLGELGLALSVVCAVAAGLLLAGPLYRAIRTQNRRRTNRTKQTGITEQTRRTRQPTQTERTEKTDEPSH
ncbi:TVP38/TMEM64 family protein [Natrinema halophilum]|uniref:TVP38/TMEM64 family protein n=1 Tax=Natrinema halophilum TaxID=1699371 RepID=A0A7D5KRI2_9EURY|nr:VTT domain-containing protein [Natrinema halophilum]QLG48484.1 VTT domain-containing protein [Natrinema halophilum]